jgi:phage anti-repressor protein
MNTSEFDNEKELIMMEMTAEGKKYREYLIECERLVKEDIPKLQAEINEKLRKLQEVEAALERFSST